MSITVTLSVVDKSRQLSSLLLQNPEVDRNKDVLLRKVQIVVKSNRLPVGDVVSKHLLVSVGGAVPLLFLRGGGG